MAEFTQIPASTFDTERPILGSTHLAMYQNFAAMAEAADGAPRIQKEALGGLVLGVLSGNTHVITDLDDVEEITQFFSYGISSGTSSVLAYRVSFSDNNGSTWGTEVSIKTFTTPGGGGGLGGQGALALNLVSGAIRYFDSETILSSTLTVPANCNAVRFRTTIDGTVTGGANALYQVTGGRA